MADRQEKRKGGRTVLAVLGILVTAVALYYLVDTFIRSAREAGGAAHLFSFDPYLFSVSMVFLTLHLIAAAWSWQLVCRRAGSRITFRQAFSIHFLAQVGKYVPGKVWGAVGKVGLSRKVGMSSLQTGHALVLETLFIISACLIVSLPVVPIAAAELGLGVGVSVVAVTAAALVVMLTAHPGAFRRIISLARKLTGRDLDFEDPGFASVIRLLPVYILVFLLQGVAFVYLARSFGMDLPMIPGAFLMPTAVGVGFLVLFSPGGLGIREVSLVWLLETALPGTDAGTASLVSLAARLWITLGEALAFFAAIGWWGGRKTLQTLREIRRKQSTG